MIDSHAHLDLANFDHDRAVLFKKMQANGVETALIPGIKESNWSKQIAIAKEFNCYFALGIHPWYVPEDIPKSLNALNHHIGIHNADDKFVALGECGLDKLKGWGQPQIKLLTGQLGMAIDWNLPVILHAVKAHTELLESLKTYQNQKGGVVHGFYGGPELAKSYIKLGYKLGIGGLIMNPNAKKLHKTITEVDIKHFIIETDSPSMTPYNSVEKRNTPLQLLNFVQKMANLQKKTTVFVLEQLEQNVSQLFEL